MESDLTAHLTTGALIVYGIEWLKRSGWCPWVRADTKRLNRVLSGVLAAIAAFGITWTYDPAIGGTITVPPLMALAASTWEWLKQVTAQQLVWDGVVEPTARRQ